jgi:two-component system chemotaxis response regulator CheY
MTTESHPQDQDLNEQKKSSILIVDDSPTFRVATRRMLQSLGYRNLLESACVKDALKELEQQEVDLIISDWTMPEMTGLDFFNAVRANERFKDLPFVIVTANQDRRTMLSATKAGIPTFLLKPLKPETLAKKLHEIFSHPAQGAPAET